MQSVPEGTERIDASQRKPATSDGTPPQANDLLGLLPGQSEAARDALLELARRWPALPSELRLAVLRVAGIQLPPS